MKLFALLLITVVSIVSYANTTSNTCLDQLRLDPNDLIVADGQLKDVPGKIQSRFIGPVAVKVWQHWQQSWNVEHQTHEPFKFELIRGVGTDGAAYVMLRFKDKLLAPTATIKSKLFERTGEWQIAATDSAPIGVTGHQNGEWMEFVFPRADQFYDEAGKRIVTEIHFAISNENHVVYEYTLKPMNIRGPRNAYWNNTIDPYTAHAGSGDIRVSTLLSDSGEDWHDWNGVRIQPQLNFIEQNRLNANSVIGLHRHDKNEEAYIVQHGAFVASLGVAQKHGDTYTADRQWNSDGLRQDTQEFQAGGGWIETRHLLPEDIFMVVPNAADTDTVYFHGIRAITGGMFWTMGTKD